MGYQRGRPRLPKATLTGSIDIVVCEREDKTLSSTAFHVRFGKLKVLRTSKKQLMLIVNGVDSGLKMKLGSGGEGYFEYETDADIHEDESELNAEGFGSDEDDEDHDDHDASKRDDSKSHWFWGKFPSKGGSSSNQAIRNGPQKGSSPSNSDSPKKAGFIRRIGDFFRRPKASESLSTSPDESSRMVDRPLMEEVDGNTGDNLKTVKTRSVKVPHNGSEPTIDELRDEHTRMLISEEYEEYHKDQVALSLCRVEIGEKKSDIEAIRTFMKHKIDYELFKDNFDEILKHPNLIIKIHDDLYNPDVGIPQIISLLAFNKVINLKMSEGVKKMQKEEEEKKEIEMITSAPGHNRNIPEDSMPTLKDKKTVSAKKR